MGGLFSRFPGSTPIYMVDFLGCDTIVEPFAGSMNVTCGVLGRSSGIKQAIAADTDPSIQVVMKVFQNPEIWPAVLGEISEFWIPQFQKNSTDSWQAVKDRFQMIPSSFFSLEEHAAVSLIYRALAHAGIVRTSKSTGKINVSMGKSQLETLPKKKWDMPLLPRNCDFKYYADWQKAIAAIPKNARACVLIDPPYWSPLGMESCYPGHLPKSPETLALFRDSIRAALVHPGVLRVVGKNYVGQQLPGEEIIFWPEMMMPADDWYLKRIVTGSLDTCSIYSTPTNRMKPKNVEAYFTFQREPFDEQLSFPDFSFENLGIPA